LTSVNSEIIEDLSISSEKSKTFTNQTTKDIEITQVEFTIEALIDGLFLNLVGIKESVISGKEVTVRKYYRQALELCNGYRSQSNALYSSLQLIKMIILGGILFYDHRWC
jgi:hypothetical protein